MASEFALSMMKKSVGASGDAEQGVASKIAVVEKVNEVSNMKACQNCVSIVSLIMPIASITIGSLYLDQCKIQQMIPIWLLVQGIAGILWVLMSRVASSELEGSKGKAVKALKGLVDLFLFAWFITGNVWVFGAWSEGPDFEDMTSMKSCEPTVFFMAFIGGILLVYCIMAFACCCVVCCACAFGCNAAKKG